MVPQTRKQFVIIVHYGPVAVTNRAIAALCANTRLPDACVIVDHGPAAAPYAAPSAAPVPLEVVRPHANDGYAAGVNVGLGYVVGRQVQPQDIVIAMNNDVVLHPDTLATIARWWEVNPTHALAGIPVQEDGRTFTGGGTVNRLTGRAHLLAQDAPAGRLDYIHGACLVAPYEVYLRVQGLPEEYFLYWEDVLFSRRVRQAGFPLRCIPCPPAQHAATAEVDTAPAKQYYLVRNGAHFLMTATTPLVRLWWRAYNKVRYYWHWWQGGPHRHLVRGLADAQRKQLGKARL